jgi:hypothetical protein
MVDVDTLITALYVMADDFARNPEQAKLSGGEPRRCRKPNS